MSTRAPSPPPSTEATLRLLTDDTRALLQTFQLDSVVSHLLRRTHFMAEELFHKEFAAESITPRQKAALIAVAKHPGMTQNALAEFLCMDRNTVADMVKRLCAAHMLLRQSAPGDLRAYQLFPTAEGVDMLNQILARDLELERRLIERLPEEYRPLFIKCLKLLLAAPGAHEESAAARDTPAP